MRTADHVHRCNLCSIRLMALRGFVETAADGRLGGAERYLRIAFEAFEGCRSEDIDAVFADYERRYLERSEVA